MPRTRRCGGTLHWKTPRFLRCIAAFLRRYRSCILDQYLSTAAAIATGLSLRALRLDPIRADIAHRIEIRFAQLRRQCPHVEGVTTRLALQPARSPLDLEIGVRPRRGRPSAPPPQRWMRPRRNWWRRS